MSQKDAKRRSSMSHLNTQELIDYWRRRKFGVNAPLRSDINPVELAVIAPQILLLGRERMGHYPIRLAGGFVRNLYGRRVAGEEFSSLFEPSARAEVVARVEICRALVSPTVITAKAMTLSGLRPHFEITVAPLTSPEGVSNRYLVLVQPITGAETLDGSPVQALRLIGLENEQPAPTARLRLDPATLRRKA